MTSRNSPPRRIIKKRKKYNYGFIFIFIIFVIAVIIAAFFLVTSVLGNDNIESKSTSSSQSTAISSDAVSATSSAYISEPSVVSTADESSQNTVASGTKAYEQSIGVKYKIDMSDWEQYVCPENDKNYLILVNKQNSVKEDFVPEDLSDVFNTRNGYPMQKMVDTAEKALEAFLLEAKEYGITNVSVTSAYRSYSLQQSLFNSYCQNYMDSQTNSISREECEAFVNKTSARAGQSEHQTGLAVDMHNLPSAQESFGDTAEAKWLAANAYRFGFILRFPADKVGVTGYNYEPWHFRFVGRTAATEIYKNGLCLEEYVAQHG